MSATELHDYLRSTPGTRQTWTLHRLPETIDRRQLTREQQRFSRVAGEYKQRRLHGNPYPGRDTNQQTFEDYLESVDKDQ
ncbi:MAG TPA: hypothetical protein VJX67_01280 [Blastocatellia bacterium]|nr:hypothetical protein [Blastocatellia bacterium]